jgi:CRISPR-associated protein Cas1
MSSRANNASDPVNSALNYAYEVLEGECRRAINVVGLEPSVGFLHEFVGYQTKQSLVYDLQEPFRWLADVTVMDAFESRALDLPDFYFTGDDYRYRFEPEAKERFLHLLRDRFNSRVSYKSRTLKWDTVIEEKSAELAGYMCGRCSKLDFSEPEPEIERTNDSELRKAILGLTPADARRREISKSTLHYLRRNAKAEKPFQIYSNVRARLGLGI